MAKTPEVEAPVETVPFLIAGETVDIPVAYKEGYRLTDMEARVLNQTRNEGIRNNTAKFFKAAAEGKYSVDEAKAKVLEYAKTYQVSQGRSGKTPLEREIEAVAKATLEFKVTAKGKKVSDYSKEDIEKNMAMLRAHPAVIASARKNLESRVAKVNTGLEI